MKKARILIVENEVIIAIELENKLQNLGYEVTGKVDTGDDAIKKAEEDKPDLILMDIRINGDKDGIEAAEIIRNKFGIPVIFSTAYLDEERIQRAKINMPFGYVLKPIQERDLKVTLEMALYVEKLDDEKKQIEQRLIQFRSVMDHASESIFITDINTGKFIDFNEAACRLLGYSREELLKLGINDIEKNYQSTTDLQKHMREMKDASGSVQILSGIHKKKNGETYPVEVTISAKEIENQTFLLAVARVISEKTNQGDKNK
ncbi:MAG: response regulator [Deltaproteobacteria bacterium]|jgi:PAS domain S-box-containing protein|nr:response regulator [Deltaproteobacteria bacterium]